MLTTRCKRVQKSQNKCRMWINEGVQHLLSSGDIVVNVRQEQKAVLCVYDLQALKQYGHATVIKILNIAFDHSIQK